MRLEQSEEQWLNYVKEYMNIMEKRLWNITFWIFMPKHNLEEKIWIKQKVQNQLWSVRFQGKNHLSWNWEDCFTLYHDP